MKKINKEKMEAKKEALKLKTKETKKAVEVPKPVENIKGVENPILTKSRNKRALAVAMARCESDPKKLAGYIVQSGIVYRTAVGGKVDTLLNQNELHGTTYAGWALKISDAYFAENMDKVMECKPFAEAITGKKMNADGGSNKPKVEKPAKEAKATDKPVEKKEEAKVVATNKVGKKKLIKKK